MNIEFTPDSRVVIIMSGAPGAGKSTAVKALIGYVSSLEGMSEDKSWASVCSADHYMVDKYGKYVFSPKKLSMVHQKCHEKFT